MTSTHNRADIFRVQTCQRSILGLALSIALCLPTIGWAGSIRGVLKDDRGRPIRRAEVCLLSEASAAQWQCIKTRQSSRRGKYAFPMLKKGLYYVSVRRIESYGPEYAWLPTLRQVNLEKKNRNVKSVDFGWISQGASQGFKFTNFKNNELLTAANFPELTQFDTSHETVILKVYIPNQSPDEGEQLVFLGQVENPAALSINPSMPNTVNTLGYEIFSPSQSASGTLTLQ